MTIDAEQWLHLVQRQAALFVHAQPAGPSFFGSALLLVVWTPSQVGGEPRRRRSLHNSSQWVLRRRQTNAGAIGS